MYNLCPKGQTEGRVLAALPTGPLIIFAITDLPCLGILCLYMEVAILVEASLFYLKLELLL